MRVGKGDAPGGEPVDVRGDNLRIAPKVVDPVVQVIDRDEQDVGSLRPGQCRRGRGGEGDVSTKEQCEEGDGKAQLTNATERQGRSHARWTWTKLETGASRWAA